MMIMMLCEDGVFFEGARSWAWTIEPIWLQLLLFFTVGFCLLCLLLFYPRDQSETAQRKDEINGLGLWCTVVLSVYFTLCFLYPYTLSNAEGQAVLSNGKPSLLTASSSRYEGDRNHAGQTIIDATFDQFFYHTLISNAQYCMLMCILTFFSIYVISLSFHDSISDQNP